MQTSARPSSWTKMFLIWCWCVKVLAHKIPVNNYFTNTVHQRTYNNPEKCIFMWWRNLWCPRRTSQYYIASFSSDKISCCNISRLQEQWMKSQFIKLVPCDAPMTAWQSGKSHHGKYMVWKKQSNIRKRQNNLNRARFGNGKQCTARNFLKLAI